MSETIKVLTKDERPVKLPPLTPADIIELQDERHEIERRRLIQDLDIGEATPEIRTRELRELTSKRDSAELIISSAFGVRGAISIIEKSMERGRRMGMDMPPFEELDLDPTDSLPMTALRILGVDMERAEADQRKRVESNEPDPTAQPLVETGT